jgi:hypothetical protein
MDGIITRARAEDFSDSSSDDDDDDTDYLKDIYGYGGSLLPSASAPASAISSAIYEQKNGKSGGNPDENNNMIINHANEFERRAREITLASTKTTSSVSSSSSSSSSSSNNNSSKITNTATATNNNNNNYNNTHNAKSSSNEKKEVADIFPLNNGAIMDYAWDDDNDCKKKTVSIYITLPGLDNVNNDDLSISLINENRGIYFTVKNIIATVSSSSGGGTGGNNNTTTTTTTTRFLKIDKLYSKVKDVKLIRKIGQNKVIIKLTKDTTTTTTTTSPISTTTTTKWYTLQESGSHTINGHDWHDSDDDWTPQEDEAAVNDFLGLNVLE